MSKQVTKIITHRTKPPTVKAKKLGGYEGFSAFLSSGPPSVGIMPGQEQSRAKLQNWLGAGAPPGIPGTAWGRSGKAAIALSLHSTRPRAASLSLSRWGSVPGPNL
jgi:hypothetical protein